MPARSPLLETVETVEAPQPPGRMPLRQHANDAAFAMSLAGPTGLKRGEASNALARFRRSLHKVEAGVTESVARDLARQPAPVPEDPDRAFDAPESA